MAGLRFAASLAIAAMCGLLAVEGALPKGCLVSYNSTKPSGYFKFEGVTFRNPTPAVYGTSVLFTTPEKCAPFCVKYKYGFQLRYDPFRYSADCWCLTSPPMYSVQFQVRGATYTTTCPSVKGPPPPHPPPLKKAPPPPHPPPPQIPSGCRVRYNSTYPGYFDLYYDAYTRNIPKFGYTKGVDVWADNGLCATICKKYYWGFFTDSDKYDFEELCYCLTTDMDFKSTMQYNFNLVINVVTKSCPNKKPKNTLHPPPPKN